MIEYEIAPQKKFSLGLKELWHYRELFYFFTWRDVKVKYKQAALGILWAILQPLIMMIMFTLIFSNALNVNITGANNTAVGWNSLPGFRAKWITNMEYF